jgi:hypothetical protein
MCALRLANFFSAIWRVSFQFLPSEYLSRLSTSASENPSACARRMNEMHRSVAAG